ncbi:MAG: DNA/RNA nuclease SfsA [Thermodesulfovibrionales bacterium]
MAAVNGLDGGRLELHRFDGLVSGRLIRRYKRFLVDVETPGRGPVTAFCPNSGSMAGLSAAGSPVMLSLHDSPLRKTRHTLEMIKAGGVWVGVNTSLTNTLARGLLEAGLIEELAPCMGLRAEVAFGDSRLDFLVEFPGGRRPCYVEVKSVTLREGRGCEFPDAVTLRGRKHLRALMSAVEKGYEACALFVVQRGDCGRFRPAAHIDPAYAEALDLAARRGVRVIAYGLSVSPEGIYARGRLKVTGPR